MFPKFSENQVSTNLSLMGTILFAFVVSGYEESIYRNIMPKALGSPLLATLIFAGLHYYTGKHILGFLGAALWGYVIFTFVFGTFLYMLNVHYKHIEIPKAVHFAFLLFNYGFATTIVGGIL